MYRINPFIHIYEKGEYKALYNTLNLKTLYVENISYDSIINNPNEQVLKEKFIVGTDFSALEYFNENYPRERNNDIFVAYFLLTSECNFNCKYCFVESRIDINDNTLMSKETAEKSIQLLRRNIKKDNTVTLIFYGGEPLLNFDTLKYIVNRTHELQMNVKYNVVTNGSILNQEILDLIIENQIEVGISLDGDEITNDTMRIDNNNNGTYHRVMHNLSELVKNNIIPGISCTISSHNIDKIDAIIPILEKFNIKGFGYNLPSDNNNIYISKSEKKAIVKNLLSAEDTIFKKRIFEDRIINRRVKSFVEKRIWLKDCAGYGQQIVITPKGSVGICHGLWPDQINNKINSYYDINVDFEGKITELPTWQEWFSRTPFNMPHCWNCEAIGLCGGGCAKNAYLRTGSIWDIDEDICILMKEVVPWIVWKYFEIKVESELKN